MYKRTKNVRNIVKYEKSLVNKTFMKKDKVGAKGERIVADFLKKKGHTVLEMNYTKKTGELDLITKDLNSVLHFVEVKTVSDEKFLETLPAEERIDERKRRHIRNTISIYMEEKELKWENTSWSFDLVVVSLFPEQKIRVIENIIL